MYFTRNHEIEKPNAAWIFIKIAGQNQVNSSKVVMAAFICMIVLNECLEKV